MKNKNTPKISVIIPTYNSEKYIRKSVNSVLNQSYQNFELLIIDDCSNDSTYSIVKKITKNNKNVRCFKTKKNMGNPSNARNLGVNKSKGEYIAFLDSDDHWHSEMLNFQIKNIKNFEISFVASNYLYELSKKKSNFIINYVRIFFQLFFFNLIKNKGFYWLYIYNPFLISGALIKKKIFREFKFNNNSNEREDLTFWLNVTKKNNNFVYYSKILLTITRRRSSLSADKIKEINIIINSICNNILKNKNFNKFNYFLTGIFFKIIKLILSKIYFAIRSYIYFFLFLFSISYFIIFYSPFFSILGRNLIYYDKQELTEAVFVLSGHQKYDVWNNSYQKRFLDVKQYLNFYNNDDNIKIFLLGRLQTIPEQKILESLLLKEKIISKNIIVLYDDYKTSYNALSLLKKKLIKDNISSVTIITSPYHTRRLKVIWDKLNTTNIKTLFFKNLEIPKKNKFFERSMNKKEILSEIIANIYENFK